MNFMRDGLFFSESSIKISLVAFLIRIMEDSDVMTCLGKHNTSLNLSLLSSCVLTAIITKKRHKFTHEKGGCLFYSMSMNSFGSPLDN